MECFVPMNTHCEYWTLLGYGPGKEWDQWLASLHNQDASKDGKLSWGMCGWSGGHYVKLGVL